MVIGDWHHLHASGPLLLCVSIRAGAGCVPANGQRVGSLYSVLPHCEGCCQQPESHTSRLTVLGGFSHFSLGAATCRNRGSEGRVGAGACVFVSCHQCKDNDSTFLFVGSFIEMPCSITSRSSRVSRGPPSSQLAPIQKTTTKPQVPPRLVASRDYCWSRTLRRPVPPHLTNEAYYRHLQVKHNHLLTNKHRQ